MSGNSILKDGCLITERYGTDLEKLNQDDRVGLMRTSEVSKPLLFYVILNIISSDLHIEK